MENISVTLTIIDPVFGITTIDAAEAEYDDLIAARQQLDAAIAAREAEANSLT